MTKMIKRRPLFLGKRPVWRIVQISKDMYVTQSWIWFCYVTVGSSYCFKDLDREKRIADDLNKNEERDFTTPKFKKKVIVC